MKEDAFCRCHPIINMFYFVAVLVFTMFVQHPIFLIISFFVFRKNAFGIGCAFLLLSPRMTKKESLFFGKSECNYTDWELILRLDR